MEQAQSILSVFLVLALLAGALFVLRRQGLANFNTPSLRGSSTRRLQVLERLPLSPQHSLQLVRIDQREILVALSPSGCSITGLREAGFASELKELQ
jgi:flagellar biogenesis protein FliO